MKLHYRKLGQGEPLIILHGLFGLSDNWQTLGKRYAEDFTVYMVDQRNHGSSPRSEDWNYYVMSDDILELVNDEGLSKINILGHSMGGKTAMFFTVGHPEKVNRLLVADISPGYHLFNQHDVLEALSAVNFDVVKSRKDVENILSLYITDNGTKQFLLKNLYWTDEGDLDWKFNLSVILKNTDKIGEAVPVQKTSVPTLVLKGGKSNYIKKEDEGLFSSIFPNSIIKVIPDAGHWLHAEQPQAFYEETLSFLKK